MAENIKKKAFVGVFWSSVDQFSGQIIQFVISIVLARLLVPQDYGIIGMLAFFMAISGVFIDGGFSSALIQRKDRTEKDLNTVFYINLGMALICYLILVISSPWIAGFYQQPLLVPVIRIYGLTLIIGAISGVNNTLLIINVDYKTKSKISITASIISGIIGILCAYYGAGVWALIVQALSSGIITATLNFYFFRWFPKLIFSVESFKSLFSYGSKLLCSSIIASAYTNIYTLVIGKQFSPATLGFYSRAMGFARLTSRNINGIISRVSFPILSKVQDEDETLIVVYKKYIQMSAFVIFPLVLLMCGIAKPLILVLLTEKWAVSIGLLQILCFVYLWDGIIDINLNLLKVKGRTDLVLKLEIIKKSIAVSILVVTILMDDIYAICIGVAVYSLIALYLNTIYTKSLIGFGFFKQCKLFLPYLILSLAIMAIALLFSNVISNALVSLILSLIICPSAYLMASRFLNLYAYKEAIQLVKPIISRFRK